MKQIIIFILAIVCVLLSQVGHADEKYICTADRATGFKFNSSSKQWEVVNFKNDAKYVISRLIDEKIISKAVKMGITKEFAVTRVGQSIPDAKCKEFNEYGYLFCEGILDFKFNRKNGRYLAAYTIGYIQVGSDIGKKKLVDEDSDTPYIEIGKCSPF